MRSVFDPAWQRRIAVFAAMVFRGGVRGLAPAFAKVAPRDGAHPFGPIWRRGIGAALATIPALAPIFTAGPAPASMSGNFTVLTGVL